MTAAEPFGFFKKRTAMTPFPYDDPIWDEAPHCYGIGANVLLAELEKEWSDEAANYLFFSALLHQGTTYPASYLAIPHLLRLAENLAGEPRRMIANLLGGIAMAGQQPAHADYSGVSCTPDSAWLETEVGKAAAKEFEKSLPRIAALSIESYREHPSHYFASGLAAAEGEIDFATWLTIGENGGFKCPTCCGDHQWWLLDTNMCIYKNDDVFGLGAKWLEDYDRRTFEHANSIARPQVELSQISALRAQLGSLDPITDGLFANFQSTVVCAHCGWVGQHP
ncbi:hypothetical protein [Cognatiyoonia sp. IB215182]|uniref:hypothetical protein n=1 Tax=Cognatiyoonia sp. IB215182 TaxID=3097353 RepID=UPI002A0EB7FE|nr:hypothetical protein [Cognatiyoonia sp. IB215182]MDX8351883.1 hypothetical protein [Cognatiyoonia sp. IB215182]